jgi:hypothetical protein
MKSLLIHLLPAPSDAPGVPVCNHLLRHGLSQALLEVLDMFDALRHGDPSEVSGIVEVGLAGALTSHKAMLREDARELDCDEADDVRPGDVRLLDERVDVGFAGRTGVESEQCTVGSLLVGVKVGILATLGRDGVPLQSVLTPLGEDLRKAGGLGLELVFVTLRDMVNTSCGRGYAESTHSKKKRHVRIVSYTGSQSQSSLHDKSKIEFAFIVNLADQVVIATLDADRGILDEPLQDGLRVFEGLVTNS